MAAIMQAALLLSCEGALVPFRLLSQQREPDTACTLSSRHLEFMPAASISLFIALTRCYGDRPLNALIVPQVAIRPPAGAANNSKTFVRSWMSSVMTVRVRMEPIEGNATSPGPSSSRGYSLGSSFCGKKKTRKQYAGKV
ncbi:hypothetical protein IWX48DRAFT_630252, partial [Phyllosticta citricarpa]